MNTPRVQLSSSLQKSETPSHNVLDKHGDSQHHGQLCERSNSLEKIVFISLDNRTYQCYECGLIYATDRDLRQHVGKVHHRGVEAGRPAGGLSVRTRRYPLTPTIKADEDTIENEVNPVEEISDRRPGQQMAIIQFRNQQNDSKQSSLIVRIEQGSVFPS